MIAGGDAWFSVLAGLFPAPLVAIRRAVERGDVGEARRLNAGLEPMWAVMRRHSGLRTMYAAAALAGVCVAAPPRPILPLDHEAKREVAAVLDALDPLLAGREA